MKKSKFTEEQIAFALKQSEMGTPVEDVCRKMETGLQSFPHSLIARRCPAGRVCRTIHFQTGLPRD